MERKLGMKKILVIYHSQQFGNTKILALALADGIQKAGGEVLMINTNERRISLEEFIASDATAIGTPDYYSYPAGTIKTFFDDLYLWDKAGKPVKGKPAVLFMTHGGGGRAQKPFEGFAERFFQRVGETLTSGRPVSEEANKRCFDLGKELLLKLSAS
jgi:multimeric flavodoxin WrbA